MNAQKVNYNFKVYLMCTRSSRVELAVSFVNRRVGAELALAALQQTWNPLAHPTVQCNDRRR